LKRNNEKELGKNQGYYFIGVFLYLCIKADPSHSCFYGELKLLVIDSKS